MQGNPLQWRWVNELGVHNAVDARELVEALLSGRMTPHVWVWRTGWKAWMRASQVPDLATAIPKGARLPVAAIDVDPSIVEPPPIPRYSFRASKYVRHTSTPVPQPIHHRQLVRRPAAPTLVEGTHVTSQTLRPPGAVPPPPRAHSDPFAFDVQRALDSATFASDDTSSASFAAALPFSSPAGRSSQRPSVAPQLIPVPSPDFVIQSVLSEGDTKAEAHTATLPAIESHLPAIRPRDNRRTLLITGVALVGALTLGIVWLRFQVTHQTSSAAAAPSASSQRPLTAFCKATGSAERIAPSIVFNVPPFVETSADGRSLAVGFADSPTSAAGIIVDPTNLSVKYAFRKSGNDKVATVIPHVVAGQLLFSVALEGEPVKESRPLPGSPGLTFAHTVEGFARQAVNDRPQTIWPTDIDAAVSGTRIALAKGIGYAVTYRQGGKNGAVWAGWLTTEAQSQVLPFAIMTDAKFVGQPNVATSDATALVSFAGRASDKDRWQVRLAKVPADGHVERDRAFEVPPGGLGGDSIAPTAVGLGQGRFLLQWSEGTAGHWQVRVQTLREDLSPWGPAIITSPPNANAGQGLLWVNGSYAVSLFIVNVSRSAELWAASLECPR